MPEGTDLFVTANLRPATGGEIAKIPEVTAFQTYVGASSPFNFNGLVRHYFLRSKPWQGDIAVQLEDRAKRSRTSHEIAALVRGTLTPIAAASGARLTIAEAPPGPPVLAPMVIELYGPTAEIRRQVATDLLAILRKTPDIADINTFMERPHDNLQFEVDRLRASMFGVSVEEINREIAMATGGFRGRPAAEPAQSRTGGHRPAGADGDARQSRQPAGHAAAQPDGRDGSARRTGTFRQQARRPGDLPQGSARSRICHRRRGRTPRRAALWHAQCRRRAEVLRHARRPDYRRPLFPPSRRHQSQRLQMGRRMGGDLCHFPRHGPGLRRCAGADLHSGRRRIQELHAAGRGDGADPADPDRHRARPLAARRPISPPPQ